MTVENLKVKKSLFTVFRLLLVLLAFYLGFKYADITKSGVLFGMRLGALEVIPAIFPFFVLSDYVYYNKILSSRWLSKIFGNILGLPSSLFPSFILGSLFGFPIGAKCCSLEYKNGTPKSAVERGVCLCSNPSLAFCSFAVGMGCFSSIGTGLCLYFSMLISTLLLGIAFRKKQSLFNITDVNSRQSFEFADSVKAAANVSLSVCSFIAFFSAVIFLVESFIQNIYLTAVLSSFLEIGCASHKIATLKLSEIAKISLLGFSLGYSGLSVIFQARASLPKEISILRLHIFKLFEGMLCAFISPIIYSLFFK